VSEPLTFRCPHCDCELHPSDLPKLQESADLKHILRWLAIVFIGFPLSLGFFVWLGTVLFRMCSHR